MALNLIVPMSLEVSKYEEDAFDYLNDDFEDNDGMEPSINHYNAIIDKYIKGILYNATTLRDLTSKGCKY